MGGRLTEVSLMLVKCCRAAYRNWVCVRPCRWADRPVPRRSSISGWHGTLPRDARQWESPRRSWGYGPAGAACPVPGNYRSRTASLLRHGPRPRGRSEEHTSELQSRENLVCRLLLEKKKILLHSKVTFS